MFWNTVAFAQEAAAQTPRAPGFMDTLPMILAIFFIMYFLVIRPQSKKLKSHQQFLGGIKKGDQVLTSGGILGTIEGITDEYVTLEIADGVRIRILKNYLVSLGNKEDQNKSNKK